MRGRAGSVWVGVAVMLAALPAPARADACADANTQRGLEDCAGKAFETADTALGASYKSVMERLATDGEGRKLLVAAQKAWLGFRDSECAFEASSSIGGSAHPMVVTQCRTRLTKVRTQALRALLACAEGDLACPLPPR